MVGSQTFEPRLEHVLLGDSIFNQTYTDAVTEVIALGAVKYQLKLTQLTPDREDFLPNHLDAITSVLFGNLKSNGFIDSNSTLDDTYVDKPKGFDAFASHPVYRAQLVGDDGSYIDTVLKFGDNPKEIEAYQFFNQFDDVMTLTPLFNSTVNVDGEEVNMIATQYLEGENLTEVIARDDPNKNAHIEHAMKQIARVQYRGKDLDIEDVVEEDPDYFTTRVEDSIQRFIDNSKQWIGDQQETELYELAEQIASKYSKINEILAKDSRENGVFYLDSSPMNIREGHMMDLAGGKKLTGLTSLVSLLEFGKKEITDEDLAKGNLEYLTDEEKAAHIETYISEMEKEKGETFTDNEKEGIYRTIKYASVQRHIEYMSYAARDIANASPEERRNEFNRQRYHMRKAIKDLKGILNTDKELNSEERLEMVHLLKHLQDMSNIVENQNIRTINYTGLLDKNTQKIGLSREDLMYSELTNLKNDLGQKDILYFKPDYTLDRVA